MWCIYAYWQFGNILPNSYLLKAGQGFITLEFNHLFRTIKLLLSGSLAEILLLSILTYIALYRRRLFNLIQGNGFFILQLLCCFLGFYLFYIAKDVIIISRYSMLLIPVTVLILALFLTGLGETNAIPHMKSITLVWCIASLLINLSLTIFLVQPKSNEFSRGFQKKYFKMAQILSMEPNAQDKSVGLTDVGIIGTYSSMKVIDFAGLVDHDRFRFNSLSAYVNYKQPDFIILRGEFKIEDIVSEKVERKLIFSDVLTTLGVADSAERTLQLWKIQWNN
jgi:hypothetical protein